MTEQKTAEVLPGVTVGIDLGTTYTSVGVWQNDKVEIIANDHRDRLTPSCVSFTETQRLIGNDAKIHASTNAENTIFDVKRLIGRKLIDPGVQADSKYWPFKLKPCVEYGNPLVEVDYRNETKQFNVEEITAMILGKMKDIAESYLGKDVMNAVITVPAHFNDLQRQATKDAGAIAGLNVLRIINEPTAAAIAYGLQNPGIEEKTILVIDFGGGTLDVSIVQVEDGIFDVKATAGDTRIGGKDLDTLMVNYCVKEFQLLHSKDISQNKLSLLRLREACERAKRTLSSSPIAEIEIENLYEGIDYSTTISRVRFESLCLKQFVGCIEFCKKVLKEAEMKKTEIDEVVLVGGSTRIPKLQSMVSNFFYDKKICKSVNADQAVVYGATVQATILGGGMNDHMLEKISDLVLLDVAPFSVGVETADGLMATVVKRNTYIPTEISRSFGDEGYQSKNELVRVFEGERFLTKYNNLLGSFDLSGIPAWLLGESKTHITYKIDADGILNVTAFGDSSSVKTHIPLPVNKGRLSREEIERMTSDAQEYKAQDAAIRESIRKSLEAEIKARFKLETYCQNLNKSVKILTMGVEDLQEVTILKHQIQNTIAWLNSNQNAEKYEYDDKHDDLKNIEKCIVELRDKAEGEARDEERNEARNGGRNEVRDKGEEVIVEACSNDSIEERTTFPRSYESVPSEFMPGFGCYQYDCSSATATMLNDSSATLLNDVGGWTSTLKKIFV